jgi:pimeloyl-ACP methyl ester carboxylesterase
MAKYAPERVQGLVIGGAHPYERISPAGSRLDGSDPRAFVEALTRRLGFEFATLPAAKQAEFLDNDFLALSADQLDRPPLDDILPTMRMPCFLYGGEADSVTPRMQESVQRMPNATFVSFPGLNHPEAFWRSDLVLPVVMKFLHGLRDARLPVG